MKKIILILILFAVLGQTAWAVNADSLGGMPWQSYIRSDAEDTASGPLYLNQVNWFYGYAEPGKQMMQWDNAGNGILGYNRSINSPLIYGVNESAKQPWMELRADSGCPALISLHGMDSDSGINDLIFIDQLSNSANGIGIYNGHGLTGGNGIYIDHGGPKTGMRIENNEWSTGCALWIDNGNTGTALEISDITSGRIFRTSQDSANKPAITVFYRGSQIGLSDDSSMFYWWGLKGRKAEVETLKTALCGLRTFASGNLCDTLLVSGVAENTTVVTANYAGGFDAITCTPLRIKVETGAIIVKRGLETDPDQYYWQATMMLHSNQNQPPILPPPGKPLGFSLFPNPSSGNVTAKYALPSPGQVELGVYNLLGQKVKTVIDQWQPAGHYTVQWDGKNDQGRKTAVGVYLYQLRAGGCQEIKKMVVVK